MKSNTVIIKWNSDFKIVLEKQEAFPVKKIKIILYLLREGDGVTECVMCL
jgi:hypothetical protein